MAELFNNAPQSTSGTGRMAWVRSFLPAVGCAFLALVFTAAGSSHETLTCDRAMGMCQWSGEGLFSRPARSFELHDVREVRFSEGSGKSRNQAESVLVFASGNELHVARGPREAAGLRFTSISRFFSGEGHELHEESRGSPWMYVIALAAAAGAIALAFRAARQPPAPVSRKPAGAPGSGRPYLLFVAAIVVVAAVGQGILMLIASKTQGTLVLECQTRCRFQGAECLPGGSVEMTLDPGSYTIEVWAASGEELWRPRFTTVRLGERTHFVCAPSP